MFDANNHLIRYAMSNKIGPIRSMLHVCVSVSVYVGAPPLIALIFESLVTLLVTIVYPASRPKIAGIGSTRSGWVDLVKKLLSKMCRCHELVLHHRQTKLESD